MRTLESDFASPTSAGIADRLKLERLKRSWTQEHLAEVARLSVRTVQRLERGEDPSAETMRILAEAFAVPVESLRASVVRRHFGAPWAASVKWTTWLGLALIITASIVAALHYPWVNYVLWVTILLVLAFSVSGYSVLDGRLLVHRLGWSKRYPLAALTGITINPRATMGSIRLFGSGGLFGYIGFFRNDILGRYRSYVTDPARSVVLRFEGICIVISPDDPELFHRAVEAELTELAPKIPAQPGSQARER
jgi:transcriptional regulator with XRE-family HTH domain